MSCLGVHFVLTSEQVSELRKLPSEVDRLDYLQEKIEPEFFEKQPGLMAESDKAWDAMHRTLTDGTLSWTGGTYPLNHAVLAGELLYSESDYIMSLKAPAQVADVAKALANLTEVEFRKRYFAIKPSDYGSPVTEEDFQYTWEWFQGVRDFYAKAAAENRFVLFTADQ